MNNYENAFNEAVSDIGGRWDVSLGTHLTGLIRNLQGGSQQMIDGYRSSPQTAALGTMPHVHLDFVDNPSFNACAFAVQGKEFIGVFAGAILIIHDLFNRMLSHPEILPEIGNPVLETNPPNYLSHLPTDAEQFIQGAERSKYEFFHSPKDPIRRSYALGLIMRTFCFLIDHEVAHLRNGHVALINQLSGVPFILEMASHHPRVITPMMNQAIEMDADCWAAVRGMARAITFAKLGSDVIDESLLQDELFKWGIAIGTLFCLLAQGRSIPRDLASGDYPPPSHRHWLIVETVHAAMLRDHGEKMAATVPQPLYLAARTVETSLSLLCDSSIKLTGWEDALGSPGRQHGDALLDEWKTNVRPLLVPLTRARDLPA